MENLFDFRRHYTLKTLDEKDVLSDPILQFEVWLNEAVDAKALEPNAMTLSTSTPDGKPSSRVVLLKQLKENGFVFFTNYESKKAIQIEQNPFCALNFVWHELERQVRVEGIAKKISAQESDAYFDVRPDKSKLGAWASPQSQEIPDREYLESLMVQTETCFADKKIVRPDDWGGFIVIPILVEFWQGRPNRLHDRICYIQEDIEWKIIRLAP